MKTNITFYGGANEIGGNKILLESADAKFLLDFGMSFSKFGKFYAEFLQPRASAGLQDYLDLGILPRVEGLYRHDLLKTTDLKPAEPAVAGVLVSHPHIDHVGAIPFLDPRIPIFSSPLARKLLATYQETSQAGLSRELLTYKPKNLGQYTPSKRGEEDPERPWQDIASFKEVECKPFEVDHSTLGAAGFILHADEGTVAYTGDIRFHGWRGAKGRAFVETVAEEEVDTLLIEGTQVGPENPEEEAVVRMMGGNPGHKMANEGEVLKRCAELVKAHPKSPVFLDFMQRDFDRFRTFHQVAKATGRKLVIPTKMAYYLDQLQKEVGIPPRDENLLIFVERQKSGSFDDRDYAAKWPEREIIHYPNAKRPDWLGEHLGEVMVYLDFWSLQNLIDLKPRGGLFIHSSSEPFTEEMAIDFARFKNWLDTFGLKYEYAHCSGHAGQEEIFQAIREIEPKEVIPVHTLGFDLFRKKFENVTLPREPKT
ncbi:MAG: MBL fold metallo-hydrolase [Halobacteria archaeon]